MALYDWKGKRKQHYAIAMQPNMTVFEPARRNFNVQDMHYHAILADFLKKKKLETNRNRLQIDIS